MIQTYRYDLLRREMIEDQLKPRGINNPAVLAAFEAVPRHLFVAEALRDRAYGDFPLPIGHQQTISQPCVVAEMTQALSLSSDERVLEIGTGSGYQAAILAKIAYRVYTIERIHALFTQTRHLFDQMRYYNIVTRYGDGTHGWPDEGPFDAIIVTAGAPVVPASLVRQLSLNGRLIIPVGNAHQQELMKITRTEEGLQQETLGRCRFVRLVGDEGWQS